MVGRATERQWSIRAKVRLALVGVLLLAVPQAALTINYLVEMHDSTAEVGQDAGLVIELHRVWRGVRELRPPDDPVSADEQTEQSFFAALGGIEEATAAIRASSPDFAAEVAPALAAIAETRSAASEWFDAARRVREVAPNRRALEALVAQDPRATGVDFAALGEAIRAAHARTDEQIRSAATSVATDLAEEQRRARRVLDHADRNLISFVLSTFLFLAALFVVLPNRLMRPVRRITRVIEQVREGRLGARLDVGGDDEVGQLARALDLALERLGELDDRKRDRMAEDAAKLEVLLDRIAYPAAIIDRKMLVDCSNGPFRDAFGWSAKDAAAELPSLLAGGADDLRKRLSEALRGHGAHASGGWTCHITTSAGAEIHGRLDVHACRGRRGAVTHLLIILEPGANEPATS